MALTLPVEIPVARCRPSPTARPIQAIKVEVLARSIQVIGLRQPINVRQIGEEFEIRGGGHRHAAFAFLGLETIPAFIRNDDDLRAELAEIDENLVRNELSAAARDLAILRRKAIYEALHPETVHGATGRGRPKDRVANDGDSNSEPPAERFTKATADDVGLAERTVQRSVARAEEIGEDQLARIEGSSLDRGDELDALAKLAPDHRERLVERAAAGEDVSAKAGDCALPNGARAIMGSRIEPPDSLDYFPTPPWATRALIEKVLPECGRRGDIGKQTAWEPACGEGHIAEVLTEYFAKVYPTDIHDYGYGAADSDFTDPNTDLDADWIITNPPFGDLTETFVLRALQRAAVGVAMFVRLQWLESGGRYEAIFKDKPPTMIAFFAERVPLCKGRWDPDGSTATAYIWLVWIKDVAPRAPFWIPPGQRDALTRDGDRERFTAHPVIKAEREAKELTAPLGDDRTNAGVNAEPSLESQSKTPSIPEDDGLDIPTFLRREKPEALP